MSQTLNTSIAVVGIDIGKNSFHLVGQDQRGTIVLRQKWSRVQVEARLANLPPCLIGMEACVGAHHLSRKGRPRPRILAEAGCSASVIAAVTGHKTLREVARYTAAADQLRLARRGIEALAPGKRSENEKV